MKGKLNVYYDYMIRTGDRPDTIAHKYYGDSGYAWLVLLFNDIFDPIFDWPQFDNDFEEFLKGKYGSLQAASETVHEYRWITQQEQILQDGTKLEKKYIVVDQTTYATLSPSERELVTKFDYEEELNQQKRNIKILDKKYLVQVKNEVKEILKDK